MLCMGARFSATGTHKEPYLETMFFKKFFPVLNIYIFIIPGKCSTSKNKAFQILTILVPKALSSYERLTNIQVSEWFGHLRG